MGAERGRSSCLKEQTGTERAWSAGTGACTDSWTTCFIPPFTGLEQNSPNRPVLTTPPAHVRIGMFS